MALKDEFEISGNWLFRWRSFLPLGLIVLVFSSMLNYNYLFDSQLFDYFWEGLCLFVSFLGLAIRAWTIGHTPKHTSGRNTKKQVANQLNTTGIYSIVRHPLYLGNYFMMLGVITLSHNAWSIIIFTLLFTLYYERIMYSEEAFLLRKFGDEYQKWSEQTPAFFPRFSQYIPSALPFSFKNVLRREYSGFFAVVVSMFIVEVYGDWIVEGRLKLETPWLIFLGVGAAIYLSLRTIKKTTNWLIVEGR